MPSAACLGALQARSQATWQVTVYWGRSAVALPAINGISTKYRNKVCKIHRRMMHSARRLIRTTEAPGTNNKTSRRRLWAPSFRLRHTIGRSDRRGFGTTGRMPRGHHVSGVYSNAATVPGSSTSGLHHTALLGLYYHATSSPPSPGVCAGSRRYGGHFKRAHASHCLHANHCLAVNPFARYRSRRCRFGPDGSAGSRRAD